MEICRLARSKRCTAGKKNFEKPIIGHCTLQGFIIMDINHNLRVK